MNPIAPLQEDMKYKLYYWDYIVCKSFFRDNKNYPAMVTSAYGGYEGDNEPEMYNDNDNSTQLGTKTYMLVNEEDAAYLKLRFPIRDLVPCAYEV